MVECVLVECAEWSTSSTQSIFTLVSDSMASDSTDKSLYINSSSIAWEEVVKQTSSTLALQKK